MTDTAYIYDDVPRCAPQFTGKERDSETGLDYFGARYYGSTVGRWMSPDWAAWPEAVPYADLTDPQTLNLYGYVRNNPLSKADADGHDVWDFLVGLGNAVGSNAFAGTGRNDYGNSDYKMGQAVGDFVSVVGGGVEALAGGAVQGGGVAACGTGVGCLAGAPAIAGGTVMEVHGTAMAGSGLIHLAKSASDQDSNAPNGMSRRPDAKTKKQADEAATGKDRKQHCAYCGQELTNEPGKPNSKEYDHVDPWSKSKDSSPGNIKDACRTCNRQKGARTPEEWKGQQ